MSPAYRKSRYHEYHILRKYKLTPEQYAVMLRAQDGVCAICSQLPIKGHLCVDRNERNNKVCGLICRRCNFELSHVKHTYPRSAQACAYFERNYES